MQFIFLFIIPLLILFFSSPENLRTLADYCDEFLVHGVDVEGKRAGIEEELVRACFMFTVTPPTGVLGFHLNTYNTLN